MMDSGGIALKESGSVKFEPSGPGEPLWFTFHDGDKFVRFCFEREMRVETSDGLDMRGSAVLFLEAVRNLAHDLGFIVIPEIIR